MKKLILLIISIVFVMVILTGFSMCIPNKDRDTIVAEFRFDVNKLTEVAAVIEWSRNDEKSGIKTIYGADEAVLTIKELNTDLVDALKELADTNNDSCVSETEINALELRRINPDYYKKELQAEKFENITSDYNLRNFIVISKGKHTGTILYNGKLKFIDSSNTRYFSIDIIDVPDRKSKHIN